MDRCRTPHLAPALHAALIVAVGIITFPTFGGTATAQPAAATKQSEPAVRGTIDLDAGKIDGPIVNPRAGGPRADDRRIAQTVAMLMPEFHISGQKLDDKISGRALELFLDSLDPMKLYFLKSDVEGFQKYRSSIDNFIRSGDVRLAYQIYDRFVQRVEQRVGDAMQLLDGEFDFTIDEQIAIDPDVIDYSATAAEARDRWRRQIKFAMLDLREMQRQERKKAAEEAAEGKPVADADTTSLVDDPAEKLRRRYRRYLRRWSEMDRDRLLEVYLNAVTNAFDPHTTYMSPSTMKDFQIAMSLNLDGIGAQLREKDGMTVVMSLIPGGAAALQGDLKADDVIVSVGQGDEGAMTDIVEMPLQEVVKLIRGKSGSTVRLGVKPGGTGSMEVYKITRATIKLESSAARGEVIEHTLPGTQRKMKIGYIDLPSFYLDMEASRRRDADARSSTADVKRILEDFNAKGVEGVVMDLSKNGGGSLTEAISLTGLFINRGPVVQVNSPGGQVQRYNDDRSGADWTGPLVVKTSQFSASASEIFAGAIRDYRRGIIVGDPETHGKGSVQTLVNLSEAIFGHKREQLGTLKVTIQKYFLPDGLSTQVQGVKADVIVPSITAKMDVAESDLKYPLAAGRVNRADHATYGMVPADLVQQLRTRSMDRIRNNEEFGDLLRRIALYVQEKERDFVSLNEAAFRQRREELNAQKEEEEQQVEREAKSDEIFADTYYNRESLSIAADYIAGLEQRNIAMSN